MSWRAKRRSADSGDRSFGTTGFVFFGFREAFVGFEGPFGFLTRFGLDGGSTAVADLFADFFATGVGRQGAKDSEDGTGEVALSSAGLNCSVARLVIVLAFFFGCLIFGCFAC